MEEVCNGGSTLGTAASALPSATEMPAEFRCPILMELIPLSSFTLPKTTIEHRSSNGFLSNTEVLSHTTGCAIAYHCILPVVRSCHDDRCQWTLQV